MGEPQIESPQRPLGPLNVAPQFTPEVPYDASHVLKVDLEEDRFVQAMWGIEREILGNGIYLGNFKNKRSGL